MASSTSNDQISLAVPTGPSSRCCACPAAKSGEATHARKSSSVRQRVTTRQSSRSSLGRSSSKDSKPSACSTRPAREAKRRSNSSKRSRGTVMALTLTMLTRERLDGVDGEGAVPEATTYPTGVCVIALGHRSALRLRPGPRRLPPLPVASGGSIDTSVGPG